MGTAFGSLELRCRPALVWTVLRYAQDSALARVPTISPASVWAILMGRVSLCSFDWQLSQLAHQHRNPHTCLPNRTDEAGHSEACRPLSSGPEPRSYTKPRCMKRGWNYGCRTFLRTVREQDGTRRCKKCFDLGDDSSSSSSESSSGLSGMDESSASSAEA